jgi:hypothetical protein
LIVDHVNRKLIGTFDAETLEALHELAAEGAIVGDSDGAVWCYLSLKEKARVRREALQEVKS